LQLCGCEVKVREKGRFFNGSGLFALSVWCRLKQLSQPVFFSRGNTSLKEKAAPLEAALMIQNSRSLAVPSEQPPKFECGRRKCKQKRIQGVKRLARFMHSKGFES
jgi:hypothetical protein